MSADATSSQERLSSDVLQFARELMLDCKASDGTRYLLSKMPFRDFRRQMWDLGIVVKHSDPNPIDTAAQEFLRTESWMLLNSFAALGSMQLVQDGIYAGYGDEKGLTMALGAAARIGRQDLVEFLIDKGAGDFNWGLKEAAAGGHMELVRYLLSLGATDYETALLHAIWNGHDEVAIYLLEVGTYDNYYQFVSNAIDKWNFKLANLVADKMLQLGGRYLQDLQGSYLRRKLTDLRPKLIAAGLHDQVALLDELLRKTTFSISDEALEVLRQVLETPGLAEVLSDKLSQAKPGQFIYIDMDNIQQKMTLNT